MTARRTPRAATRVALSLIVVLLVTLVAPAGARADGNSKQGPPLRDVRFEWDQARKLLYVSLSIRDVVDASIQKKMRQGLPTTIVLTATLYRTGSSEPLATTAQTCKVTWHVWEEAFRIEVTRPGQSRAQWTTTMEGVLRRCADVQRLLAGNSDQVPFGATLYMHAKVQVNPVSKDLLAKIKRWVSRPSGTGTAAPGDALFSTFTGLFLQRIGDADRELKFTTKTTLPVVPPPPEKEEKK